MATLATNALTLADHAKRLDPDGKVPIIVELLAQTNEILMDMLWIEANQATSHRVTVRTGLPSTTWRLLNQGVAPSKSTTAQIDEAIAMLEAWSEVDVKLANLNGNQAAFRLSEAMAFIEAMNQEFSSTLFFGNQGTSPEEFTGLAPRFNSLSAANAENVLDAGGTGSDNSSIWLVSWAQNQVCGIFPKGSKAGLDHKDMGEVTVEVTAGVAGNRMRAFQDMWSWDPGLAVKDWRYVVRIANIDISDLVNKSSAADLFDLMIKATHRLPSLKTGKPVFYMNRSVIQMLDIQSRDDTISGGGLNFENVAGVRQQSFRGLPVRLVDSLIETEAQIT